MNNIRELFTVNDKYYNNITIGEYIQNMRKVISDTKDDINDGNQWLKEDRYHYLGIFLIGISIIGFIILLVFKNI